MTKQKQIHGAIFTGISFVALLVAVLVVMAFARPTHANPSGFSPQAMTATATTSPAFQTPGTATSTVVYDSYGINGTNEGTAQAASRLTVTDSAELLVQFSASSTASKLNLNIEYSDNNVDWYQASPGMPMGYASSTLPISLVQVPQYQWGFASSTLGQQGLVATNNRDTRAIEVQTPTRYTRAVFTCATGGANCAVWAQFIPKKQNP